MAERASDRLVRLLGLIAYVERHESASITALAEHFGVPPAQIVADVELLWVTGTPGYWPQDLIDFDVDAFERGEIRVLSDRGMRRPLRLGTREAIVLLSALQGMRELLGAGLSTDLTDVLDGALAKLTAATGEAAAALDIRLPIDASRDVYAVIGSALALGRRVRLRYVNAADEVSERDVDPARFLTDDANTYLQGWCYRAGGERTFRLDRVLGAEVLETPVEHRATDGPAEVYEPAPQDESITIELDGRARWIAEQIPVDDVTELDGGAFRIRLRVANRAWLRNLLLRHARSVRAIEPAAAAAPAAESARAALAAYAALGH